jgi:hypothetical protein
MSNRSEGLTALDAGALERRGPLLLKPSFLIWKRCVDRCFLGVALLFLICASLLIGYELGTFLFSMSR